jgi:hypothetical protein
MSLSGLPAVPDARPSCDGLVGTDQILCTLCRARGGDVVARASLSTASPSPPDPTVRARVALVVGTVPALVAALSVAREEHDVSSLADALADAKDTHATPALVAALEPVRSRVQVVRAIERLGDPSAVPALLARVADDPYVPVRAAMVRAISSLVTRDPAQREVAQRTLFALAAAEADGPVLRALVRALTPGNRGDVSFTPSVPAPAAGRERWLVVDDERLQALELSSGQRVATPEGVGRVPLSVRAADLPPQVRIAGVLSRPAR